MVEAERELDRSSLEVLSESVGGLAGLSSATFCCGGQETESNTEDTEKSSVDSQNAGVNYVCLINVLPSYVHSLYSECSSFSASEDIFREPRGLDVCAAAGSAAFRKEDGFKQNDTQEGRLAGSVTGKVRNAKVFFCLLVAADGCSS